MGVSIGYPSGLHELWQRKWMNEWMKSRGWEDNRRALLQYILTCEQ